MKKKGKRKKVKNEKKITRRTIGARGCKFEQF